MDAIFSRRAKSGNVTDFVDLREEKDGTRYLAITSSSPSKADPQKYTKRTIHITDDSADNLIECLQEATAHMRNV